MSNGLIARAVMQDGTAGAGRRGLLDRLFAAWFQNFVYNQIWEDPEVDLAALSLRPDDRVVTIASGGCNVLNYLLAGPASIVAVDLNPAHIALTRLKLAAVRHLPDHDTFFRFFGAADERANVRLYTRYLRPHLDETTRAFWDGRGPLFGRRINYFAKGLYHAALLGRFIGFAHFSARLFGIDLKRLLSATNLAEQARFFEETIAPAFDRRMIRALCGLPVTFYSLGIPPAQFEALRRDADGGDMVDLFRDRLRRLACNFPISDNYFAWQAFGRSYDCEHRQAVPAYLRAENFDLLRENVDRVEIRLASVTELLADEPASSCDAYVLLDAQDWMAPAQLDALWREIGRTARPSANVIFRTAGRDSPLPTSLEPDLLSPWHYEPDLSRAYFARDRSAIYGGFHLYRHIG
jgi:S-adenosylmethionine-diacylglycerol 3-amino-3-carboxypropyl transferase